MGVLVTPADCGDREGEACVFAAQAPHQLIHLLKAYFSTGVKRLRKLWVDGGYAGQELKTWVSSLKKTHKIGLEVVQREGKGFQLVKRRWVVERTFAWLGKYRRLSKDYESLPVSSEAMIQLAMINLMIHRLKPG